MRAELMARTASGTRWRAAELALADRLVLRVVVPDDPRVALAQILPAADSALDQAPPEPTSLALPRWSARSDEPIPQSGASLPQLASDARLSSGASHAAIAVAEQGVAVKAEASDAPPTPQAPAAFSADRAFCFEITDRGTGIVILAGWVANPTL
jgi:hypothetical protein